MRLCAYLTIHMAAVESNCHQPLRPLRTRKEEPSSRRRKNRARAAKSSPNATVFGQLSKTVTHASRPVCQRKRATVCPMVQSQKASSLTSSQVSNGHKGTRVPSGVDSGEKQMSLAKLVTRPLHKQAHVTPIGSDSKIYRLLQKVLEV